jgi:hypothetical protein
LAFAAQADLRGISATIFYKRLRNAQKCGSLIDGPILNLIPILCEHMLPDWKFMAAPGGGTDINTLPDIQLEGYQCE